MTISQVSNYFYIPKYTLRYWEKIGILTPVNKDAQGNRIYTVHNLREIRFAILMHNSGVGVKSLVKFMKLLRRGPKTALLRRHILKTQLHYIDKRIAIMKQSKKHLRCKLKCFPHVKDVYHYELKKQRRNQIKYRKMW